MVGTTLRVVCAKCLLYLAGLDVETRSGLDHCIGGWRCRCMQCYAASGIPRKDTTILDAQSDVTLSMLQALPVRYSASGIPTKDTTILDAQSDVTLSMAHALRGQ